MIEATKEKALEIKKFFLEKRNLKLNTLEKVKECEYKAVSVKMSRGSGGLQEYGLMPPHSFMRNTFGFNQGRFTDRESRSIEFKYYLDEKNRPILIKRYYRVKGEWTILHNIFFDYKDNITNIIFSLKDESLIAKIARCVFDADGRPVSYLETVGYSLENAEEWEYCYINEDEYEYLDDGFIIDYSRKHFLNLISNEKFFTETCEYVGSGNFYQFQRAYTVYHDDKDGSLFGNFKVFGYVNTGKEKKIINENSEAAKMIIESSNYFIEKSREAEKINVCAKIDEYVSKSVCSKCSSGASNQGYLSDYGMFPPSKDIYITSAQCGYGRVTQKESEKIDFKYYFDEKGRAILIEKYGRDNPKIIGKIVSRVFIDYFDDCAHILSLRDGDSGVAFIALCKFDEQDRLLEYLETGNPPSRGKEDEFFYYMYRHEYNEQGDHCFYSDTVQISAAEPVKISSSGKLRCQDGKILQD